MHAEDKGPHPRLLTFPHEFRSDRGTLSWSHFPTLPFVPVRAYWASNVPPAAMLGGHALKRQETVIFPVAGEFQVVTRFPGEEGRTWHLGLPYVALYAPRGTWREVRAWSEGAGMVCLASTLYDPGDYIRSWADYMAWWAR
jgi:hypothetical protein